MFKIKKRKWKMYLYAENQCIKKIKINDDEEPFEKVYIVNIYFKKHILGTNFAKVVVKPYKLKCTNESQKEIHIEAKLYEGVEIV